MMPGYQRVYPSRVSIRAVMAPPIVLFRNAVRRDSRRTRAVSAPLTLLLMLSLFPGSPARAQYTTAEISGVVKDAQGAVIAGPAITATHVASGFRADRLSDITGRFLLAGLPLGEYILTVAHLGFDTFTERRLVLQVSQKIDIPVTLQIAQLTNAVTVTGAIPLLQTVNVEIGDDISNQQVVELPLNGRQFLQLSLLSAG